MGVIPALQAVRNDPQRDLQVVLAAHAPAAGARRAARSSSPRLRWRSCLLVTSGLLLRSLQHLFAVPMGFDSSHLLTVQVQATGRRFGEDSVTHGSSARR